MNIAFEGWKYIDALFRSLWEPFSEYNKGRLVAPRFVFRGVTQRHFTSSEVIRKFLSSPESKDLLRSYRSTISKRRKKNPSRYGSVSECEIFERWCYNSDKNFLAKGIKDLEKKTPGKPDLVITEITRGELAEVFNRVKPQYIRSGAVVRLYKQQNRTQNDYICYLRNLILQMRSRYPVQYSNFSDLEILADIQHKGGASCLVDFSSNFLVSLWFATQDYENKEEEIGYVFCYDVNTDAIELDNLTFLNQNKERKSIEQLIFETTKSTKFNGIDSYKFWLWKPTDINSRITRQDSIFIFGIEKFKISEHPVVVLPIPHQWKRAIQHVLKDFFGIYGETIYADASGLAATNTKIDPLRTQTQYFNETAILNSESNSQLFECLGLFQKGMSALVKSQYEVALDFFSAFEGTNMLKIRKATDQKPTTVSEYNLHMLIVELKYSKGMCLRHMGLRNEAIMHYDDALKCNVDLLSCCGIDFSPYDADSKEQHDKLTVLKRYASNKLFKILEDYIGLLYDTHHYFDAHYVLSNIVETFNSQGFSIPSEMSILIATACNEIKILAALYKNPRLDEVKFMLNEGKYNSATTSPFCNVLNDYFKSVEWVLNGSIDSMMIETSNAVINLKHIIKKAIEAQPLSNSDDASKYIFTAWDFKDLKEAIMQLHKEPVKRKALLYLTSLVEDCQRQIDGRKRPEIY